VVPLYGGLRRNNRRACGVIKKKPNRIAREMIDKFNLRSTTLRVFNFTKTESVYFSTRSELKNDYLIFPLYIRTFFKNIIKNKNQKSASIVLIFFFFLIL
jgi:hypothetical protein